VENAVSQRASRLKIAKDLVLQAYVHATQVGKELEALVKVCQFDQTFSHKVPELLMHISLLRQ
jgi:hypothetical protein